MVSKIWFRMSATFIYLLSIQNHLQKHGPLNVGISELIPKGEGTYIYLILYMPFCIFLSKCFNCHPDYFGIYFSWWYHQIHFKMVHSNAKMQNLQFINLKCVAYTQPIWVTLTILDVKYLQFHLYTAKLLFHQSPTRHSHYTVTGQWLCGDCW